MMPEVRVVCSDYSPITVERLKKVFIESEDIIRFDIHTDSLSEVQKKYIGERGICIMYRIDAGFSDEEWTQIFEKFSVAGIPRVLYIPTGMLTMLSTYNRISRQVKWFFEKTPAVLCGHVRTKKSFERFWSTYYAEENLVFGGLKGFLLTRKTI